MPWLGREPERRPRLSAETLARHGERNHSSVDNWYRTPHTHEQLAVSGRSARSDRVEELERERERRRAEERERRRAEERERRRAEERARRRAEERARK